MNVAHLTEREQFGGGLAFIGHGKEQQPVKVTKAVNIKLLRHINSLNWGKKPILWVSQNPEIPLCAADLLCRCFLSLLLFFPRHTEAPGSPLVGRQQNGHHYKQGFVGGNAGGSDIKKKKKVLLPISTILSNLAEEVTVLTLAGSFLSLKRHFYSFSLKEVTL